MSVFTRIREEGDHFSVKSVMGPLIVITAGMFMVVLDATALNVMLPRLILDFHSSYHTVQWAVTGYTLAQAAVVPIAGWMTDRFGMKPIFLSCIGLFIAASLGCAWADSIDQLILFRILQGLGGGMVVPIALAFAYRLTPPRKAGVVMGIVTAPMLLAPAFGPILSGWMVEYFTWRWVFLINIPTGLITILFGVLKLPAMERQAAAPLDRFGVFLAPLAFTALCYGISEGSNDWGGVNTLTGLSVGGAALVLFVISQLHHRNPLLELRVFQSPQFTQGILVQWIAFLVLYGISFLTPQFLQKAQGYTAFEAGLIMSTEALTSALVILIAGRFFDQVGARPLVVTGMGSVAASALILSLASVADSVGMILISLILLGVGVGLSMMPLNTHLLQSAPRHLTSRVSALTGAMQQVMSSLAVAGSSTLLMNHLTAPLASGQQQPEAWSAAFGNAFHIVMSLTVAGALLALFIRRPQRMESREAIKG